MDLGRLPTRRSYRPYRLPIADWCELPPLYQPDGGVLSDRYKLVCTTHVRRSAVERCNRGPTEHQQQPILLDDDQRAILASRSVLLAQPSGLGHRGPLHAPTLCYDACTHWEQHSTWSWASCNVLNTLWDITICTFWTLSLDWSC